MRYAAELGYDVTVVKDAIASYQWEEMRAALEINLPNYATSILKPVRAVLSRARSRNPQKKLQSPRLNPSRASAIGCRLTVLH